MSEVSNEQILQAIYDLSGEVNGLKAEVAELRQEVRENTDNLKKLDAKVTVLSEGLLDTQAEVKILKNAK